MKTCLNTFSGPVRLTALTNLLRGLLRLAAATVATTLLGPDGRRGLAATGVWSVFLAGTAMVGLTDASVYSSVWEPTAADCYASSAALSTSIASLPVIGISHPLMLRFWPEQILLVPLAAGSCPLPALRLMASLPNQALRGRGGTTVWRLLRPAFCTGTLMVMSLPCVIGQPTSESVVIDQLAAMACLSLGVVCVLFQRVPRPFWVEVARARKMVRLGLASVASTVPRFLSPGLGPLVMASVLPTCSLGWYPVVVSSRAVSSALSCVLVLAALLGTPIAPATNQQALAFTWASRLGLLLDVRVARVSVASTMWGCPLLSSRESGAACSPCRCRCWYLPQQTWTRHRQKEHAAQANPTSVTLSRIAGWRVTTGLLTLRVRPARMMEGTVNAQHIA